MKSFFDEFTRKQKNILSILSAFVLPFIIFLCGPCDIFLNNRAELPFAIRDFLPLVLLFGFLVFAVFFFFLFLTKGKLFHILLALTVWLSVMFFVQGSFLNIGLDSLVSDGLEETNGGLWFFIDLGIWILGGVIAVLIALFVKDKPLLGSLIPIVLLMVLAVQSFNLVMSFAGTEEKQGSKSVLTTENMFEVSEKDNVIVFILDRFDLYYYRNIVNDDPSFFASLDGFTFYDNNISLYSRTYPSVAYMLTGVENDFSVSRREYFEKAYRNSAFFEDLKKANYKINLYIADYYAYDDASVFGDYVSNISHYDDYRINDPAGLATNMIKLSFYRYFPQVLKSSVSVSSSVFAGYVESGFDTSFGQYISDDAETYRLFRERGLETQDEKNTFTFLHLNGCHSPWNMNENGERIEETDSFEDGISAMKGCFRLIYEYIDQLKELGLYENATIIITGDHARAVSDRRDVEDARVTTLFVKEKGSAGTPLATSSAPVCQENLRATIIKSAGIVTKNDYGLSFAEIGEKDSSVVRKYLFEKTVDDGDQLVRYEVLGDAKDFSNWTLAEYIDIGKIYK